MQLCGVEIMLLCAIQCSIAHNSLLQNKLWAENLEAIEIRKESAKLKERINELYKKDLAIAEAIKKSNPVNFKINYPADGCEHTEIFGKLAWFD